MNFPASDSMISCKICQQYSIRTSALEIPESTIHDLLVSVELRANQKFDTATQFLYINLPQKATALGRYTCDFTLLAIHWCCFWFCTQRELSENHTQLVLIKYLRHKIHVFNQWMNRNKFVKFNNWLTIMASGKALMSTVLERSMTILLLQCKKEKQITKGYPKGCKYQTISHNVTGYWKWSCGEKDFGL